MAFFAPVLFSNAFARPARVGQPFANLINHNLESKSLHQRLNDTECEQLASGYSWPGNRLTYLDMRRLTYVANMTKRPINQIIKEAVGAYTTTMIAELQIADDETGKPDSTS